MKDMKTLQVWLFTLTRDGIIELKKYSQLLEMKGVTQSMSRRGNCLGNCMTEYIEYYNTDRIKMELNGVSHIEFRAQYAA
ncbi:MAG: IS3 family transposase [Treponema sp.]|nr:IS3 family transposase [Treponema sp.]